MDQDKIEWAVAYHLVGDAQVTAARVPSLGPHAIRLGVASQIFDFRHRFRWCSGRESNPEPWDQEAAGTQCQGVSENVCVKVSIEVSGGSPYNRWYECEPNPRTINETTILRPVQPQLSAEPFDRRAAAARLIRKEFRPA